MNRELIEALDVLEKEKDISKEVMLEAIETSLITAYKNHFGKADNVKVNIDRETGDFTIFAEKTVVEQVEDKAVEISLAQAQEIDKKYKEGDVVNVEVKSKEFGRIATQNAKNIITQTIREEERKVLFDKYYGKEKDIVTGIVQRINDRSISINLGKADAVLSENEMVKTERFAPNDRIKLYVIEVKNTTRGPRIVVSRTHPELVKRLFEAEVNHIRSADILVIGVAHSVVAGRECGAVIVRLDCDGRLFLGAVENVVVFAVVVRFQVVVGQRDGHGDISGCDVSLGSCGDADRVLAGIAGDGEPGAVQRDRLVGANVGVVKSTRRQAADRDGIIVGVYQIVYDSACYHGRILPIVDLIRDSHYRRDRLGLHSECPGVTHRSIVGDGPLRCDGDGAGILDCEFTRGCVDRGVGSTCGYAPGHRPVSGAAGGVQRGNRIAIADMFRLAGDVQGGLLRRNDLHRDGFGERVVPVGHIFDGCLIRPGIC